MMTNTVTWPRLFVCFGFFPLHTTHPTTKLIDDLAGTVPTVSPRLLARSAPGIKSLALLVNQVVTASLTPVNVTVSSAFPLLMTCSATVPSVSWKAVVFRPDAAATVMPILHAPGWMKRAKCACAQRRLETKTSSPGM